ncbi:hypothetical protein OS493_010558 [Desmophyllum pertusum]|uniref:Ubiquitin-like protease family profile domain-containing protein n=1 Tax=Desmophyllum pertusum TaxID=174260 RepID=A0A9W9ZRH2_9CNID|nr:hypothetical protein OS493_010558 [Desmophyllum pertusum]
MAEKIPVTPTSSETFVGLSSRRLYTSSGSSGVNTAGSEFVRLLPRPATITSTPPTTGNVPAKPSKYNPPDFITTVKFMRAKLYEVARSSEDNHEPSELKPFHQLWKNELQKEDWYTDVNQFKFYVKVAQLTRRCFGKVLEIDRKVKRRMIRINNAQNVTQGTFKEILYGVDEQDQYSVLSDLAEGKMTLAEWRKTKTLRNECQDLELQLNDVQYRLEEKLADCEDLRNRNEKLREKMSRLEKKHQEATEKLENQVASLKEKSRKWKQLYVEAAVLTQASCIQVMASSDDSVKTAEETTQEEQENETDGTDNDVEQMEFEQSSSDEGPAHRKMTLEESSSSSSEEEGSSDGKIGVTVDDVDDNEQIEFRDENSMVEESDNEDETAMGDELAGPLRFDLFRKREAWETKTATLKAEKMNKSESEAACEKLPSPTTSQEHQYVAVAYTNLQDYYLGKVESESGDGVVISFLDKRARNKYQWPKAAVTELVEPEQIVCYFKQLECVDGRSACLALPAGSAEEIDGKFERCRQKLVAAQRQQLVDQVWDNADVKTIHGKVGLVTWKDVKTIQKEMPNWHELLMVEAMRSKGSTWKPGWLNDEVINAYLEIVEKKANKKGKNIIIGNTFFYDGLKKQRTWRSRVDLSRYKKLIFPGLFERLDHWMLGVVNIEEGTIAVVDPANEGSQPSQEFFEVVK